MGEMNLWTSVEGLRRIQSNKCFYAYSEKTEMNCLHISIPFSAINYHEKSANPSEGMQFMCYEMRKW